MTALRQANEGPENKGTADQEASETAERLEQNSSELTACKWTASDVMGFDVTASEPMAFEVMGSELTSAARRWHRQ